MPSRAFELAMAMLQSRGPGPAQEGAPASPPTPLPAAFQRPAPRKFEPGKIYPMDSQRLKITSPKPGSGAGHSVHMPVQGRLKGIEVFVDTPGPGDTITVRLDSRTVIDRWFVDLAATTSYEKDLDEPVMPGDILSLYYLSADSTSKTVTWTPTLET